MIWLRVWGLGFWDYAKGFGLGFGDLALGFGSWLWV